MDAFAFRMHLLSPTKAGSDLVGAYKRAPTIRMLTRKHPEAPFVEPLMQKLSEHPFPLYSAFLFIPDPSQTSTSFVNPFLLPVEAAGMS